jgi:hypothetical protein
MSGQLNRTTRKRLFEDEELFNHLLPFARYDSEKGLFLHTDASIWAMYELEPKLLTSTSDTDAFETCSQLQEMLDSLDPDISIQCSWITTFDVDGVLKNSLYSYPTSGPAGWMAKRWIRMMHRASRSSSLGARPRKMKLIFAFRYDPPWKKGNFIQELKKTFQSLFKDPVHKTKDEKTKEYEGYANKFRGIVDGKAAKLKDLGLKPKPIDAQSLIVTLFPLLNRRSVKQSKIRKGRQISLPIPIFDKADLLSNQISETPAHHPKDGYIIKDGRVYRSVSMVKAPKNLLPVMIAPLQSTPYENIITVTYSKDDAQKQIARLDSLDASLGYRENTARGRSNQKVQTQIQQVRQARQELYNNQAQLVRVGLHQTFICQTEDEATRATSEAVATFPQLYGARGMVHEITDLACMINSLPGCYDPTTDGAGWTNVLRSSRASRLFPLWGNWRGTNNPLFVLPSLWNRELIGFDFYDSNTAPNVLISGVSGAGKSYLLCYLLINMNRGHYSQQADGRYLEKPPITFVFDKGMTGQPCGFEKVAKLFGGKIYEATPSKAPAMNFLGRLGDIPPDPTHDDYKDLVDMCADIIADMASESNAQVDRLSKNVVTECLVEAHRLYKSSPQRREFILSDVVSVMKAPKKVGENDEMANRRQRISQMIGDYYGDGTYARFFDRPGSLQLRERFIVFDLKALSRNPDLQRVFLKVAMLWADTVMNDPKELDTRKVLVFDEAHDLIGKTSAGTIETAFRLYRKRKGIVIAASQSGEDFYVGAGGQAIVQNSAHKIFLRQDPSKFHMTAQAFNLTKQQQDVILQLKTIKGIESQFFITSDIGEGALCLPVEPAFYWASTNNGDDNQLFQDVLAKVGGNFWVALEQIIKIAPYGVAAGRVAEQPSGDINSNGRQQV